MTNPGGNTDLSVVPDDVKELGTYASDLASSLTDALKRADADVRSLLKSGWTGEAAQHFSTGWDETQSSGTSIIEALTVMANKLGSATKAYLANDNQFAGEISSLNLPPVN